jgi:hypothetical protein
MTTPTAARPNNAGKGGHWYTTDAQPAYEIPAKTTGKMRAVTLKDARELNLLPSVTTVLKVLHKEALVNWLIEQAVLAVVTTPRKEGEGDDAFIERVLHTEKVQDQETRMAADKGTRIHDALEGYFQGQEVPEDLKAFVMPPAEEIASRGALVATERVLVGDGFAGKTDLILEPSGEYWELLDYKTTKKIPDPKKGGAWLEHRLQLAAYAKAWEDMMATAGEPSRPIRTGNVYISSVNPGEFVVCMHEDWQTTYFEGFAPLVTYWQFCNNYRPKQADRIAPVSRAEKTTAIAQTLANAAAATPPEASAYEESKAALLARNAPAPESPAPTASNQGPADPPQPKNAKGKRVVWTQGVPS